MDARYEALDETVVGKSGVEAFKMLPPELQAAAQLSKEFEHPEKVVGPSDKRLQNWKEGIRLTRQVESAASLKSEDLYSSLLRARARRMEAEKAKQQKVAEFSGLGQEAVAAPVAPVTVADIWKPRLFWIAAAGVVLLILKKKRVI